MKKIKLDYPKSSLVILGGHWGLAFYSGSRCSNWGGAPSGSTNTISSRGISNHFKG